MCAICRVTQPIGEFYHTNYGKNRRRICRSCEQLGKQGTPPQVKHHALLAAVRQPGESCRLHFPAPCNCPAIARLTPAEREQVQLDWLNEANGQLGGRRRGGGP